MAKSTIERSNSDKAKGFRLQKIRAIKLMIEEIIKNKNQLFYTAIEVVEDVFHTVVTETQNNDRIEELKSYDSSAFTLQSDAVKNTLVSFFDIYFGRWQSSDNVKLGFYTTATIGKEKKNVSLDGAPISPPNKAVLKIFNDGDPLDENTFKYFKATMLEEYYSQYYKVPASTSKNYQEELAKQKQKLENSNYDRLKNLTMKEASEFISQIYWHFGDENIDTLKTSVLNLIKQCPLSNINNEGKEETIFNELMERLDARQSEKKFSNKFIFGSDVIMVFKNAETNIAIEKLDPSWEKYSKESDTLSDKRTLGEKLLAVCPSFSKRLHTNYSRKACTVKGDDNNGKSFLALKYRVFLTCEDYLAQNARDSYTQDEIISEISQMLQISQITVENLKQDYTYKVSNKEIIECIIYDLFDECFIALDEI